jgi:hypothetical protein
MQQHSYIHDMAANNRIQPAVLHISPTRHHCCWPPFMLTWKPVVFATIAS